jgi:5-hydroxyisourate hydrolase-like protein (transthyretin family)
MLLLNQSPAADLVAQALTPLPWNPHSRRRGHDANQENAHLLEMAVWISANKCHVVLNNQSGQHMLQNNEYGEMNWDGRVSAEDDSGRISGWQRS